MKPLRIFISSVQKEFSAERIVLRDWLRNDALMHRFFEPFLFEDVPAADRRADEVYLDEVAGATFTSGCLATSMAMKMPKVFRPPSGNLPMPLRTTRPA
jgi:hypothetical protein